jgi:microcystin synthetase protein McyG
MSETPDYHLILQEALLEIRRLREAEARAREPVAVIGLGCRLPGADGPDAFWRLLAEGRDAVSEVPADRWDAAAWYDPDPDAPGKINTRYGGFLRRVDGFDPGFFGISPREAAAMDPQQRVLLEVAWETLEHANIPAERLRGSTAGVFVGFCGDDYARLAPPDPEVIEAFGVLGTARSTAAGRIAYVLGLQGPVIQLDTACSSSLAAVHLALQSLRRGECELALAGGVNLILSPATSVGFSRLKALAPDGRCKTFDAAADGYGRGEGCGLVALKPLKAALADGDPVLAVLRGSALNHDGASNGFTAPNGQAQEALLRKALADAGLAPADIHYVEAHGTGTALGDPIEVHALGRVLGEGRGEPLLIGSVKTNIGHLEGAAGIAGLIKAVLALQARRLPPSLHFREPNPHIRWRDLPVEVVAEARPWTGEGPRRAGVSAFGLSGTNVHVIVEEAPAVPPAPPAERERSRHLLVLSARTDAALRDLAAAYAERFAEPAAVPTDICFTAATGRSHFERRAAVQGRSADEFRARLAALAETGETFAEAPAAAPKLAFLFTGQGSQYPGMGHTLYETQPTFRAALERCAALLDPLLDRPLLEVMFSGDTVHATAYTQPALFALEYALATLWQSFGVRPAAVLGHSVGEYVAACLAGVLSLEDGLTLIAHRGRLIQSLPAGGGMAAVLAPESEVRAELTGYPGLAVAAVNGPRHVVVSGAGTVLDAFTAALAGRGIVCLPLKVSHAFHSPLMDPILAEFARVVDGAALHPPTLPLIANLGGGPAGAEIRRTDYWVNHLRQPVRFADGLATLAGLGIDAFLEVGPHPTLAKLGRTSFPDKLWLPSLQRDTDDWAVLLDSLSALYRQGFPIDWAGFDRDYPRRAVSLPTYPFQRQRCWRGAADRPPIPRTARQPGLYTMAWREAAAGAEAGSPATPQVVLERLGNPDCSGLAAYGAALEQLEALSLAYVAAAFTALGGLPPVGTTLHPAAWAARAGVAERHARLFGRLLDMLGEAGWLHPENDGWRVVRALPAADPAVVAASLGHDHPELAAELDLVVRCGTELPAVLRGERDPLELLFPGGDADPLARLYGESPAARFMNELAAEALAAAVRDLPAGRRLRVLEVGAGTGATSACLLAALPEDTEYWCTDLSNLFLKRARERFRHHPGLKTAILDLERPPEEQGFAGEAFDLCIAANVLHATRDLRLSLERLHRLLRPHGLLLLLEGTARRRWLDITFGLTQGWWQCTDAALRPNHPLLSGPAWQTLLASAGFGETAVLAPKAPPAFQQALILARRDAGPGCWLLLADRSGLAEKLAARLGFERCIAVFPGPRLAPLGSHAWQVNPNLADDFRRLLELLDLPLAGAISLWGLDVDAEPDAEDLDRTQERLMGGTLHLCQALVKVPAAPALWVVTRGAQAVAGEAWLRPAPATLWGLCRSAQAEHPELGCRLVDLDPAGQADEADRLAAWLLAPPEADLLALRGGRVYQPRLQPLDLPLAAEPSESAGVSTPGSAGVSAPGSASISAPGSAGVSPAPWGRGHPGRKAGETPALPGGYLITGGLGGLGFETARWLAARGATRLYLVGRGADSEAPSAAVRELRARGVAVVPCRADVSRFEDLRRVFEQARSEGPLRGVVHAAGTFSDRLLAEHRLDLFREVFAAKVLGAWNLHRLTRDLDLDFFLLYSSAASLLGAAGLANYGAANAFLDTLAHARNRQGLPALALNWGPWAGLGMSVQVGGRRAAQWSALGLTPLPPELALAALEKLLASGCVQAGVLDVDFSRYLRGLDGAIPAFYAAVAEPPAAAPPQSPQAAAETDRQGIHWIRTLVAEVLGFDGPEAVPPDQGFFQLGLDSLTALELHKRLQAGLGRSLPSTLSFKYPTAAALAAHLFGDGPAPAAPDEPEPPEVPVSDGAIAAELALLENLLAGTAP